MLFWQGLDNGVDNNGLDNNQCAGIPDVGHFYGPRATYGPLVDSDRPV